MTRYLIVSDIHLNVNRRLDDTIDSLNQVAEIADRENAAKVLVLGDSWTSRRPTSKELTVFERWITKLIYNNGREVVIIRGNHDESPDNFHSYHSFEELGIGRVHIHKQPWIEDNIFLGHMMLREAAIGPTDFKKLDEMSVADLIEKWPNVICYCLGDIHRGQTIQDNPLVFYAGSIVPVDFGERNDVKRVVILDVEDDKLKSWKSIPLKTRPMIQLIADYSNGQSVLRYEDGQTIPDTEGALVKLIVRGTKADVLRFDEAGFRDNFRLTNEIIVEYDVIQETRSRDERVNETVSAATALELYLEKQELLAEQRTRVLELGKKIIEGVNTDGT